MFDCDQWGRTDHGNLPIPPPSTTESASRVYYKDVFNARSSTIFETSICSTEASETRSKYQDFDMTAIMYRLTDWCAGLDPRVYVKIVFGCFRLICILTEAFFVLTLSIFFIIYLVKFGDGDHAERYLEHCLKTVNSRYSKLLGINPVSKHREEQRPLTI